MDKDVVIFQETKGVIVGIPIEEYKELLIIKGKYEELKSQQNTPWTVNPRGTTVTYTDKNGKRTELTPSYEVTC